MAWDEWKWRPVYGQVTRLDRSEVTPADVESVFAEAGIVTRGRHDGDAFRFEVAVTGRRRRLATIVPVAEPADSVSATDQASTTVTEADAGGEAAVEGRHTAADATDGTAADGAVTELKTFDIRPTVHLSDFVDTLMSKLGKVEVSVDGIHKYASLALGEVDISDADLNPDGISAHAEETGPASVANPDADDWIYAHIAANAPIFRDGPMVAISDAPFSAVPALAAKANTAIGVCDLGHANVMVADAPLVGTDFVASQSTWLILLSVDKAGVRAPVLAAVQGHSMVTWNWDTDVVDMPWVESVSEASHFAHQEMGPGALVSRITEDQPNLAADTIEAALTVRASGGAQALLDAFHMPAQVGELLAGHIDVEDLTGMRVFEPQPFGKRFQEQVAWEVAGRGVAPRRWWDLYRALYVDHPDLLAAVSAGQSGLGIGLTVWGASHWRNRCARVATVVGSAMIAAASVRLVTSSFVRNALHSQGLTGEEGTGHHE